MSADTTPISPSRFAGALKDLSIEMLHIKVLEIRNSIAHLQYSNDQLKPFAEGTATALSSESNTTDGPDQDCLDAIRENEQVIDRMAERIAIIRCEVEERGVSWTEFQSSEDLDAKRREEAEKQQAAATTNGDTNGDAEGQTASQHSAWTDGTFQTGTIQNGQVRFDSQPGRPEGGGGSLTDEELRRAMEERMRNLGQDDDDDEGGMHL